FMLAHTRGRTDGAPPGGYDLYLASTVDAPVRVPRAVWLYASDPAAPRPLRVAALADIHVGKGDAEAIEAHLATVISTLNADPPDLVLIAGDVVDRGDEPTLSDRAQQLLSAIEAPLLIVPGNHDHGFSFAELTGFYGIGWENFGCAFHPWL